ncbi:MAG: hypothetical protein LBE31_01680 [Deltaproteobacteria bacterium]|jgi:hypothetical protein|nr:hypothetical protein [Deltaproteobacteria bacterium]
MKNIKLTVFFQIVLIIIMGQLLGCTVKAIHREGQPLEETIGPVRAVIEHGDWLVIRGTTGPDNFIGSVTNMPFSHSSIYDAENDQVIESDRQGVHVTPLTDYLSHAARIWVIKPMWATPETRPLAVELARSFVGRPYDFTGLIGLGLPDSYYCSEVAMSAWKPFMAKTKKSNPIPLVISPGRLHHWGRVVYDSMEIGLGKVPESLSN